MQSIKELRDEIVAFGERLRFENFEETQKGHLTYDLPARWLADDEEPWVTHDFYLRVGLHLGRVMQVIMSCGHFVKMRKEDRWTKESYPGIVPLDPLNPHLSLYKSFSNQYGAVPFGYEHWRPDLNYTFNPYLQQQQYYPGYTYPGTVTWVGNNTAQPVWIGGGGGGGTGGTGGLFGGGGGGGYTTASSIPISQTVPTPTGLTTYQILGKTTP